MEYESEEKLKEYLTEKRIVFNPIYEKTIKEYLIRKKLEVFNSLGIVDSITISHYNTRLFVKCIDKKEYSLTKGGIYEVIRFSERGENEPIWIWVKDAKVYGESRYSESLFVPICDIEMKVRICSLCNRKFRESIRLKSLKRGIYICDNCFIENYEKCSICRRLDKKENFKNVFMFDMILNYSLCCECLTKLSKSSINLNCSNCKIHILADRKQWESGKDKNHLRADNEVFCYNCFNKLNGIKGFNQNPVIMRNSNNDKFNRRFGVEFEMNSILPRSKSLDILKKEIKSRGKYIRAKSDGSLEEMGLEIVTGVYYGKRGFNILKLLCSKFNTLYRCDDKCGLHIHLDTRDLSKEDLINLHYVYKKIEPYMKYYVNSKRITNTYCKSLNKIEKGEYIDKEGKTIHNFLAGDRYRAVNFEALNEHGTIEIRLMEGTTDYNRIYEWLLFHMSIIDFAKRKKDAVFKYKFNLKNMKTILGNKLFESLSEKIRIRDGNINIFNNELTNMVKSIENGFRW